MVYEGRNWIPFFPPTVTLHAHHPLEVYLLGKIKFLVQFNIGESRSYVTHFTHSRPGACYIKQFVSKRTYRQVCFTGSRYASLSAKRTYLPKTYLLVGTFRNELFFVTGPSIAKLCTRLHYASMFQQRCPDITRGGPSGAEAAIHARPILLPMQK